jgi:hypothetical protein
MLLLLTWASLAFGNPPPVQPSFPASDTIKRQGQDSLSRNDADPSRIRPSVQERPSITKNTSPLGACAEQPFLGGAIDTLLKKNPILRRSLLRELLIPSEPLTNHPAPTAQDLFNQRLEEYSRFTPFARMSLIAKHYAIYNSSDRSLKSYQLDIRRTLRWWFEEVLK